MRLYETYRLQRGDNLGDPRTLNQRWDSIDVRLAGLEATRKTWDDEAASLQGLALQRINEVLAPAFAEVQSIIDVGAMFVAHSTTAMATGTGSKTFAITAVERPKFAAPAYVAILASGATSPAMLGTVTSYDRESGALVVLVDRAIGIGVEHGDWTISAASATDYAAAASEAESYRDAAEGFRDQASDYADLTLGYSESTLVDRNTAADARDEAVAAEAVTTAARDDTLAAAASLAQMYLGGHASDPVTDNQGNALVIGATYYNTVDENLKTYAAGGWTVVVVPVGSEVVTVFGRSGSVTAASGDYNTAQVSRTDGANGLAGATAEAGLTNLATAVAAKEPASSFSSAGRTFVGLANAAAMRTNLALVPGTDVQAYTATLASLAALGSAADKFAYTTGINVWAEAAITSLARTILARSAASNIRSDIGLVIGTDVQAYAATLASIAALGSAADKMLYTTGISTFAETAITSLARTILARTAASNIRSDLGLIIGANVQAYDAELAALAGLTSAADKAPYFTGAGTADLFDLTATARSLLDDGSTSVMRTTLGLVIGTDVQAYAATLASLAALGSAADKLAYTTGINVWAEAAITSLARTLIGRSTASSMRSISGW